MGEDTEKEYVILTDEYEDEYMYEMIGRVEFNETLYGLLVSVMVDENDNAYYTDEDEEAELVIVRVAEDEDGEEVFEEIEDDDEYDELVEFLVDEGIGIKKELH
jgi:uncharacterized protein YrzB (UPF0473 family)